MSVSGLPTLQKTAPLERKQFDDKLAGIQTAFEQSKLKGKTIEVERKKLEIEAQTLLSA